MMSFTKASSAIAMAECDAYLVIVDPNGLIPIHNYDCWVKKMLTDVCGPHTKRHMHSINDPWLSSYFPFLITTKVVLSAIEKYIIYK